MLGIDLLIIIVFEIVFTIWMVSVDKSQDYFQGIKKYKKEEFNKTMEELNYQDNYKNLSHTNLTFPDSNITHPNFNTNDSTIDKMDMKYDEK